MPVILRRGSCLLALTLLASAPAAAEVSPPEEVRQPSKTQTLQGVDAPKRLSAEDAIRIERAELESVPSALTGFTAALPLLPGATNWLSPLSISGFRGSQPAATTWRFDGVALPVGNHVVVGPAVLQDASVESLTLYRRAAPIDMGRSLAGAIVLEPALRNAPGVGADLSLDLLRAGALTHFTSQDGATRASVGASVAWTPLLATRAIGSAPPTWDASRRGLRADLADYSARVEQAFGDSSIRVLGIGSHDAAGSASDTDLLGARLTWHRVDLLGRARLGGGEARAGVTWGSDSLSAELGGPIAQLGATLSQQTFAARAAWERALGTGTTWSIGADSERRSVALRQDWRVTAPELEGAPEGSPILAEAITPAADALISGAWAELRHASGESWGGSISFRVDDYHLFPGRDFVALEPRAAVWKQLSDALTVSGGAALVHQLPTFYLPMPGLDLTALRFGLQRALRTDAALTWLLGSDVEARLSVFVDPLFRTIELSPLDRDFLQTVKASPEALADSRVQRGIAHGAEVVLRRTAPGLWFGWFSAGWQRSVRETQYVQRNDFGEPISLARATLPVPWEQNFMASVVGGRTLSRWTLSGAMRFHTGAPERGGLSSTTQREGLDRLRPGPRWIEADAVDADRLPPFFRFDARVAYRFAIEAFDLRASLDLQNLTLVREIAKYNYSEELDPDTGALRLTRTTGGSVVPGLPLPMLGLAARY